MVTFKFTYRSGECILSEIVKVKTTESGVPILETGYNYAFKRKLALRKHLRSASEDHIVSIIKVEQLTMKDEEK